MPSRKIPKNYRSVTGTFPSLKNKSNISYESLLERDFYLLLEFNSNVKSYEEQPFTIKYLRNNNTYKYTPDTLVHYYDETLPTVYEIKMSSAIKNNKVFFEEKINRIEEYVKNNDMNFKVFTELEIEPIFLENALFLYRYRTLKTNSICNEILNKLKNKNSTTINLLLSELDKNKFKQAEYIPFIWLLVFKRIIYINMNKKITNSSTIRLQNEEN